MTASAMVVLEALRTALAAVPGVVTCKIGLEGNMTPADYPMIRLVPSTVSNAGAVTRRRVGVLVYFGKPIHEFATDLAGLYTELFDLERRVVDIIETTPGLSGFYLETIADEDRLDAYKLMAVRAEVEG